MNSDVSAFIKRIIRESAGQELPPGSIPEDRLRTDSGSELDLLGIIGGKAVWAPSSELGIIADTSAIEAALAAHIADGVGAHDSSAITYSGGASGISSTDVEGVLEELDADIKAHISDTIDAHDASAISYAGGTGMAATDVEAAIDELATEKVNYTNKIHELAVPTAATPMNSQKFTGLAAGSANGDSLRYEQLFTTSLNLLNNTDLALPANSSLSLGTYASTDQTILGIGSLSVFQTGDSTPRVNIHAATGLSFGAGGVSVPDWSMSRTAANELTVGSGDVIKHDTAAENSANTVLANTAYVDRAVGSVNMARPAVRLHSPLIAGAAQVTNATGNIVSTWQTEAFDNDSMHDASTNPGRITIQTAGNYDFSITVDYSPVATTGFVYVALLKNGSVVRYAPVNEWSNTVSIRTIQQLTYQDQAVAGDYYEAQFYQNTGATRTLISGAGGCEFSAVWVGGTGAAWGNAGARAYNSGVQSIPSGTATAVTFDSETFDIDGMHSTSSNTSRLTCVTPGTYVFTANVAFAASAAGAYRDCYVRVNGTTSHGVNRVAPAGAVQATGVCVTAVIQLVVGDYVEVMATQDSGGALNTVAANTTLSAVRVGYQTNPSGALAYTAPTFSGTWANYGASWRNAGYAKSQDGVVNLTGLIKRTGTTGQDIFTLPAGYRPSASQLHFVPSDTGSMYRVDILATGVVQLQSVIGAAIGYVSLAGITFIAEA